MGLLTPNCSELTQPNCLDRRCVEISFHEMSLMVTSLQRMDSSITAIGTASIASLRWEFHASTPWRRVVPDINQSTYVITIADGPAPNRRQVISNSHSDPMLLERHMSHVTQHIRRITGTEWTMCYWGWEVRVGNPLIPLLLTGSTSHGDNT